MLISVTAWAGPKRLNGDDLILLTQDGPYFVYSAEGEYSHFTFYKDGTQTVTSGMDEDQGTWRIVNDTLCLGAKGKIFCIYYEMQFDGAFKAFYPDGKHQSTFVGKAGLLRIYVNKKVRWFQSGNLAVGTYNSEQLKDLFLGSEMEGTGEVCVPEDDAMSPGNYLAALKFIESYDRIWCLNI